jgi:tRNA pseudouridine38-40 synthase
VQGELESALRRILQEPVRVVGSGRTDAGAHAEGQVAHVRTRAGLPGAQLQRALNHVLPHDIAVLAVDDAPSGFHAQRSAVRKTYRYRMYTGAVAPPFIRPYVHHVRARLDVARMRREAAALKGRHNFTAFARAEAARRYGATRTIHRIALRRAGSELQLDVTGNGFLHTMVRSIAGTLIDVGRGRLPAGTVRRLLRSRRRADAGVVAPARGLTLRRVVYGTEG